MRRVLHAAAAALILMLAGAAPLAAESVEPIPGHPCATRHTDDHGHVTIVSPDPVECPGGQPRPTTVATPAPPASVSVPYVVVAGDTLWGIAMRFGYDSWQPIYAANSALIPDPDSLAIGVALLLPNPPRPAGDAPGFVPKTPIPSGPPAAGKGDDAVDGGVIGTIYAAADRYGQSRSAMLAVARCESNLDPGAYNPRSGASGLFQFLAGTWASTPYAGEDIFDASASANAAAWMWSVGRRGEWVC